MEVQFTPDQERQLSELAGNAGLPVPELVRDVVADYLRDVAGLRNTLESRLEDIESGRVAPIDGEAFFESLRLREQRLLDSKSK